MNQPCRVLACVQARMGSQRLPGKMLVALGGVPILSWVLRRVGECREIDRLVLATSTARDDMELEVLAKREGVETYRGSEDDVLQRFCDVIRSKQCEHIVRICADNPLVAPEEVDRVIRHHLDSGADYTFNHVPDRDNGYPDGLGAEVFRSEVLLDIERVSSDTEDREHINNYVLANPGSFHIETVRAPVDIAFPDIKLDIDTREDLVKLESIVVAGDLTCDSTAKEVVEAARECSS